MKLPRLLLLLLALPSLLPAAASLAVKKGAVEAQFVSDAAAIQPGKPFTVALRLQHDPHWHSYWIAPGTGYATSLTWTLPDGFKAGDIQWPTPHVLKDAAGKITGNGYEGETYLLVEITPPMTLTPGSEIKLKALAEWLMCQEVCMPGDAKLEISFPVATAGAETTDARWAGVITGARAKLPKPNTEWDVTAAHTATTVTLRLTPRPGSTHRPADLHFFAADSFTDYAMPEVVTQENGGWALTMPLDAAADKKTARLTGVLASSNGWAPGAGYDGLVIDVLFAAEVSAVSGQESDGSTQPSTGGSKTPTAGSPLPAPGSLLGTLLLAFVGGMILNLMPCVFPVLGIKILGFVNQSGHDRRKVTLHGLVFALGVLLSFWALAGVLLALRAGGSQLGWGFQLQSPAFVFCMAAFLLIFALNMSGLFEVGLSATGVGGNLQMKEGFGGSFFTGALATLVATPCSAPFLAPALGAALSLSAVESFLVFTAIAVGLALPYLLLSIFPAAVRLLPRPGAWMETFKQLMAFPLYATVGWLLWVLAGQTKDDDNALLLITFGFVLVAMAAGKFVYVDFTARWCATCQTNKAAVFHSDQVLAELKKKNVVLLRGDWTNRDPKITAELARWNRSAVPFNLIYAPGKPEPVVLPELLTPDRVLAEFAQAAKP
jgi:DsbC/DsbD-like thiol-disulfide interchange protein/cytochrome c biogenesis protein CcdA